MYATEHVSDDSAIATLALLRDGLRKAVEVLPDFQTRKLDAWIDGELGRLWKRRGWISSFWAQYYAHLEFI